MNIYTNYAKYPITIVLLSSVICIFISVVYIIATNYIGISFNKTIMFYCPFIQNL